MRHNKKFNHLGRKSAHRKAMLANMASSLIQHKRITTTIAKAKALRMYVEPLITKAKEDTTHSRRVVFSYLQDKNAVSELFREVSGKIADRPGGYTRILKTGNRLGDNADMCIIELVDFNEAMLASQDESQKSKKRRSRRGSTTKKSETPVAAKKSTKTKAVVEEAVEEVKTEEVAADEIQPEAEIVEEKVDVTEETDAPVEEPVVEEPKAEEETEEPKAEEGSEEKKD
ncbi:MAG: 50S ribosomal protein L17 [Prolixibacteraceae bacterium]|nr:50S ribosomal protein L17 [Prolixibacteraceae bacterium]MBN2774235.1 50S ribosomal protein L17 [Prolixibacteraceae bacterium]